MVVCRDLVAKCLFSESSDNSRRVKLRDLLVHISEHVGNTLSWSSGGGVILDYLSINQLLASQDVNSVLAKLQSLLQRCSRLVLWQPDLTFSSDINIGHIYRNSMCTHVAKFIEKLAGKNLQPQEFDELLRMPIFPSEKIKMISRRFFDVNI